jgi:hypothetical protein
MSDMTALEELLQKEAGYEWDADKKELIKL